MDLDTAVNWFISENNLYRLEGRQGVENLAKIVNAIGYSDPQKFGQISGNVSLGDIFVFLEDNPGAIEALIGWIKNLRHSPEWVSALKSQLPTELVKEHYSECPSCDHPVHDGAKFGDFCNQCDDEFVPDIES